MIKYPTLYRVLAENVELTREELKTLFQIKKRIGRREFNPEIVKKLIQLGLAAGDFSRAYVTDAGDTVLESVPYDKIPV